MGPASSSLGSLSGPCPEEETLLRFADGGADEATAAHLQACSRCRRALSMVQAGSGASAGARSPGGASEGGADDEAVLVARIEAIQKRRASALAAGTRVDRYQIIRRVGEGGMGVVYAARDPELERVVAIKLMHPPRAGSGPGAALAGDENRRLLREARALAKVAHPNVVSVFDVGTTGGVASGTPLDDRVFVVMELVEGGTMREWLATKPDRVAVIDAFIQAGRGLTAAHARALIHRDFKPDNVLIGDDGRVRVTDFGLARMVREEAEDSRITGSKAVVGTPSYMAPEVQRGDTADARSDQFSFAVALYRALAGHSPRPDLPLADEGRAIPRGLRKVLRRALALERDARFPSMEALVRSWSAIGAAPLRGWRWPCWSVSSGRWPCARPRPRPTRWRWPRSPPWRRHRSRRRGDAGKLGPGTERAGTTEITTRR
ncbi:MAG: protein kinase [Polyangiaceae bacterium]